MPEPIKSEKRRRRRRAQRAAESGTIEGAIRRIAKSGRFAEGVRAIVEKQRAAGLAITYQRGDKVVREFPDGRIEVIAELGCPVAASSSGAHDPGRVVAAAS